MVCPPTTSEAEARWPRFGLVVVATYSRRDKKDQMIRPYIYTGLWGGANHVAIVFIYSQATNKGCINSQW
jgi:hypothetical protein